MEVTVDIGSSGWAANGMFRFRNLCLWVAMLMVVAVYNVAIGGRL
jgi:hypothetical protein